MYHALVKKLVRDAFAALNRGDYQRVVAAFDERAVLTFPGDHDLAGCFEGADAIKAWFELLGRRLPGLNLRPRSVLVEGFPWDTRVATLFEASATLANGASYRNEGVQLLRLRWGRVLEERLYEDTQTLAKALQPR